MPFAELDRVALVVPNIEEVAAAFKQVFEIDLAVREVPELGLKAAVGNNGIELVEQTSDDCRPAQYWRRPLAALCVHVQDVEVVARRMEAAGYKLVQQATTSGGMREYFYGANFHGIPIVVHESSGDLLHDITGDEDTGRLDVEWMD